MNLNPALLAVPFLGIGLIIVTYLSNYYYKESQRLQKLGAKNALMYFYVQRDIGNLHQALEPLPTQIPGMSYEQLASYELAVSNVRQALGRVKDNHVNYERAAELSVEKSV